MDAYLEQAARNGRILVSLLGGLGLLLAVALLLFPAPNMPHGSLASFISGVALISFAWLAPKKLLAWLGEVVALWP